MEEIKQLLEITFKLKEKYKQYNKQFSLDGKLVGDIGEVLAAEKYGLDLFGEIKRIYDAVEIATGKKLQIKSTFKGYCYFPFGEHRVPDYFLSIQILETGEIEEIYNGPGKFLLEEYILKNNLKPYKNSYYSLAKGELEKLNEKVDESEKIKLRKT